jgi:hypothetical protein
MIDWLLANQRRIVGFSRWILLGCTLALVGASRLPKTPIDRVFSLGIVLAAALVFAIWLIVTLVTLLAPRAFEDLRRHRSEMALERRNDV